MEESKSKKLSFGKAELVVDGKWLKYYSIPFTSTSGATGVWETWGKLPPEKESETIFLIIISF